MPEVPGATAPLAAPPPLANCCGTPDPATRKPCALCFKPTCGVCRRFVNGKGVCRACLDQIKSELEAEKPDASSLPMAVLGGVVGAVVGGGAWALIAILTGLAIGYVAIGVGWVAGMGVHLGAGKKRGPQLQFIAIGCALLGLFLGKYFIVAHYVMKEVPEANLSYVDGRMFKLFFQNIGEVLRPFDILWVILALGAARRATQPTATFVSTGRSRTPR